MVSLRLVDPRYYHLDTALCVLDSTTAMYYPAAFDDAGRALLGSTFDELIDLEHSVDPLYRAAPTCRFMFNDGVLKALRKLKDGQGRYIWQPPDVKAGQPPTTKTSGRTGSRGREGNS